MMAASSAMARCALGSHGLMSFRTNAANAILSAPRFIVSRWQIRFRPDGTAKAAAKDLHPKLLAGMFFFLVAGATGGITSLATSGKPIFESPHAVTGLLGLFLLGTQTALSSAFEANPGLRNVHATFGTSISALFLVHAVFGIQLGLSY